MKHILIWTLAGLLGMVQPNLLCAQTTDSASSKIWGKTVEGDAVQMTSPMNEVRIIDDYVGVYGIRGGRAWSADTTLLKNAATGNLTQVLQNIPSLSLKRYAPGGLATPTFRGTGAGHTQVYWEGLPLNSSMLGQQDFALGAGNLFSQVTALYGGSSLTLGSGGLGGAINLSSGASIPYPFQREIRLRQQAGSWNTYNSSAEADFVHKKWVSSTRAYFNSAANNFPFANVALPNKPIERLPNAGLMQFGGSQYIHRYFGNRFGWISGNLWAYRSQRALPPTMLTTTSNESQADAALRGTLAWSVPIREGILKVQSAYFGENMRYLYPQASIDARSGSQRFILATNYFIGYSKRKISLTEVSLRYVNDHATSDGYVGGAQQQQWSGMARGEWKIKPRNYINMLVRQEIYDQRLSPTLGYLGGSWRLPRLQGNLMANLSRNYRYPTLNDRFWQPGGNPNLRPELSHSVELQFLHQKDLFDWPYNNRNWSIGGFHNHVNDWILWVPGTSNIWHPENVRTVNARGIEASASYAGDISAQLRYKVLASYTFTQSIDQDGYQLIYTPKHIAFAKLQVWWGRFDIQYYQDYNSSRYTVADNSASIPGFSTGDLSLGVRLGKPKVDYTPDSATPEGVYIYPVYKYRRGLLDLQLGMRNLWNAQYQTVAWRPMPGRSVFVRLDWTLSRGTQNR